jgi:UrcA family protein
MQRHLHACGGSPGIGLALLLVTISSASQADTSAAMRRGDERVQQSVVRYNRHDLRSSSGQGALYRRLQRAAERVCAADNGATLRERYAARECAAQSLARAVADVNAPAVTAMHQSKTRPATTS